MSVGNADQSAVDSYALVYETDGTDTEPTAFPIGITSGDMDLLAAKNGGKGEETKAYRLAMLITGQPAGTGTILITGAAGQGPEEPICSLAITIGSVVETGDRRWADTIVMTSFHLGRGIHLADSGNSHPSKLGFDAIGYRYIRFYATNFVTTTNMRVYARYL